jgi:hypothetical protein
MWVARRRFLIRQTLNDLTRTAAERVDVAHTISIGDRPKPGGKALHEGQPRSVDSGRKHAREPRLVAA